MVRIEEVDDSQDWASSDGASSDAGSLSSDDDLSLTPYDSSSESLSDRFYALRDIIPASTRLAIYEGIAGVKGWTRWGWGVVGKTAWVVTTSALLVGLPMVLSIEGEQGIMEQERAYLAQQNPAASTASSGAYPGLAAGAGSAPTGVVPPGF